MIASGFRRGRAVVTEFGRALVDDPDGRRPPNNGDATRNPASGRALIRAGMRTDDGAVRETEGMDRKNRTLVAKVWTGDT